MDFGERGGISVSWRLWVCFGCDFVFVCCVPCTGGVAVGFRWSSGLWFYKTRGERKLGEGSGKPNQRRERLWRKREKMEGGVKVGLTVLSEIKLVMCIAHDFDKCLSWNCDTYMVYSKGCILVCSQTLSLFWSCYMEPHVRKSMKSNGKSPSLSLKFLFFYICFSNLDLFWVDRCCLLCAF